MAKYTVEVEIDGKKLTLESDHVFISKGFFKEPSGYEEIIIKYPSIFEQVGMSPIESCMAFGIECGLGWFELLNNGCYFLDKIYHATGIKVIAQQVKEKFGGLRFYYGTEYPEEFCLHFGTEEKDWTKKQKESEHRHSTFRNRIEAIISAMEGASYTTCDCCGKPGKPRGGNWIVTSCEDCEKKHQEAKALENKISKAWYAYKEGMNDEDITPYHEFKEQYKDKDNECNRSEDGDRT